MTPIDLVAVVFYASCQSFTAAMLAKEKRMLYAIVLILFSASLTLGLSIILRH